jgi:hypothetical protein
MITTSNCLTASRREFWNRTLLTGTKISEIFATQLVFATAQNLFQVLEIIFVSGLMIERKIFEHFFLIFILFMLIATVGSSIALLLSILVENYGPLTQIMMTAFLIVTVLQGTLW